MTNKKEVDKRSKVIHICIVLTALILIFAIAGIIMLKYQVEGETKPPFKITKIIQVSTAEGFERDKDESKWNFNLDQNNDIYISIDKNEEYTRSETIKSVTLENFQITKAPEKGEVKRYKPTNGLYKNEEASLILDTLQYKGSKEADSKKLEISNQGGVILFRTTNQNVTQYKSNEAEEIVHDGTLLAKAGVSLEQLMYSQRFDIMIETGKGIKYKATVTMDFPVGNILQEGKSTIEKTEVSDIIFKRV